MKKTLTFFLFFFLIINSLSILFLTDNAKATSIVIENFDNDNTGQPASEIWFATEYLSTYFEVTSATAHSGIHGFLNKGNYATGTYLGGGFGHMFFFNADNVTSVSFYYMEGYSTGTKSSQDTFGLSSGTYNGQTIDGTDIIEITKGAGTSATYSFDKPNHTPFISGLAQGRWYQIVFTTTSGTFNCSIYNATTNAFMGGYSQNFIQTNGSDLNRFWFNNPCTIGTNGDVYCYIDDFSVTGDIGGSIPAPPTLNTIYFKFYEKTGKRLSFFYRTYTGARNSLQQQGFFATSGIYINSVEVTPTKTLFDKTESIEVTGYFISGAVTHLEIYLIGDSIEGCVNYDMTTFKKYDANVVLFSNNTYYIYFENTNDVVGTNINTITDDYNVTYGNFYLEFAGYGDNCYFRTKTNPIIIYNLNGSFYGNISGYIYTIYDDNSLPVYNGQIIFNGQNETGYVQPNFLFQYEGYYYVVLYNITSDLQKKDIVYRSNSIYVCLSGDDINIPVTPVTNNYDQYRSIIALLVIMGFILFPVIIFRTNQFFINNGTIVVAMMGIIGLGFCIGLRLIDLWFAFLIALICVGILALKIYQIMNERGL